MRYSAQKEALLTTSRIKESYWLLKTPFPALGAGKSPCGHALLPPDAAYVSLSFVRFVVIILSNGPL